MCSCAVGYSNGPKTFVGAVGGKGGMKAGNMAMVWDNEKSFNDLAWVALAAVPAMQAVKSIQATEQTARIVNTNATNAAINASKDATTVRTAEIAADVTKATVLPK
jgi:hypothetical protein